MSKKIRNIYLMTFYQPQPCIEADSFIKIQRVESKEEYRLTRTYGNVNFTDLWLSITGSVEELKGKYMCQHFSLLCDEDPEFLMNYWKHHSMHKSYVLICFIKVRSDIKNVTVEKIIKELGKYAQKGYIFKTIENADILFFYAADTIKELNAVRSDVMAIKCDRFEYGTNSKETVFYSLYSMAAKFDSVSNPGNNYVLKNVSIYDDSILLKNDSQEAIWCSSQMDRIRDKMKECLNIRNKKWLSYYMALYQIVNLLGQYEQEVKLKDLFYVFFPPVLLFCEQLEEGKNYSKELLSKWMEHGESDNAEKAKKDYFEVIDKIERATSEFIDSMETILHHIGISCANILNFGRNNGLTYDIPLRLYMLYVSSLHLMAKVLNKSDYVYRFLVTPLAYSRPVTHVFDFGLEPANRLISVEISRHQMFSPRAMLAILTHEAAHYIGLKEARKKRAECMIDMMSVALLEILLPDYMIKDILKEYCLAVCDQEKILDDWKIRKKKYCIYFRKIMSEELRSRNENRKYPYYLSGLETDFKEIISILLFDEKRYLRNLINEISPDIKICINRLKEGVVFFKILQRESEMLEENIQKEMCMRKMDEIFSSLSGALKEAYADISSIKLLKLDPEDYLEAYILTESYNPQSGAISNILLNRVALVYDIFKKNDVWDKKWKSINGNTWKDDSFLWMLKQRVDEYYSLWSMDVRKQDAKESLHGTKEFDPFVQMNIINYEKDYLNCAYVELEKNIKDREEDIKKLTDLYRHFKVYQLDEDTSFEELFHDYESVVETYKTDIIKVWKPYPEKKK